MNVRRAKQRKNFASRYGHSSQERTVNGMREELDHLYYVDRKERTLLLHSLVELKNQLIQQCGYGDCGDELIFKAANTPVKKVKQCGYEDCGDELIFKVAIPLSRKLSSADMKTAVTSLSSR